MAIAKTTCTCKKCGQKFEVRVKRSNRRDACSFEQWAAENITECPECRDARKTAGRQAYAEKVLAPYTLPALKGSQKQIAWAEKLREKALPKWIEWLGGSDEVDVTALQWVISRHTDCRWWIDNRNVLTNQDAALELLGKEGEAYEAEVLATPAEKGTAKFTAAPDAR